MQSGGFLCAQRPPARGYRFPGSGGSDALSSLSGGVPPSGFSGGVLPPGFGLGLAITKEMAEKLGGEISASGAPESGTVFHVAFCRA